MSYDEHLADEVANLSGKPEHILRDISGTKLLITQYLACLRSAVNTQYFPGNEL